MFYVDEDYSIHLTRGDTAILNVSINDESTGGEYSMNSTDTIRLTVKKKSKNPMPVFQKQVIGGKTIRIEPEDTNAAEFGRYVYDVELTTADGDVYTIIPPSTFEILEEVTW